MVSSALIFSQMDALITHSPPMGDPRRLAFSGLTGQRSGTTSSIADMVSLSLHMTLSGSIGDLALLLPSPMILSH